MKIKIIFFALVLGIANVNGQKALFELNFIAVNDASYIPLDSIKVMNRTQDNYTTIYWPDTSLSIEITSGDLMLYIGYSMGYPVGVKNIKMEKSQFQLFQNYPNPVKDQSHFSLFLPRNGEVDIKMTDIQGRLVYNDAWQLDKGTHLFSLSPGSGNLFLLTARWNSITKCMKISSLGQNYGKGCSIQYLCNGNETPLSKEPLLKTDLIKQESGILDTTVSDRTYTFQFTTNIPCPGTPTVAYEGQIYNTIQIYSQCWLKENLNVGTMIPGTQETSNNGVVEKYCYNNDTANCTIYGGLYQWNEMMKYTTIPGTQGICPPSWHIPTDEEWKVLEGAVDSYYGIGDTIWNYTGWEPVGHDVGINLKSTWGWDNTTTGSGNGEDVFGFTVLASGFRQDSGGDFKSIGQTVGLWTSSSWDGLKHRGIFYDWSEIQHMINTQGFGFNVRCIRNY